MRNLFQTITRSSDAQQVSFDDWAAYVTLGNNAYGPFAGMSGTLSGPKEDIPSNFVGYVRSAYKSNGVVFACMQARMLPFSEARFQFRQMRGGRPGDLFGSPELLPLEKPWRGGSTGDLLARAMQDVDLAGNFYAVRHGDRIYRRRPDWVTIILGSEAETDDPDEAELVGYVYQPGGRGSEQEPVFYEADQVAHWAPLPDPEARYRGMSWLTPILREVQADSAATSHKQRFFEQGATPNMIVSLNARNPDHFEEWVRKIRNESEGAPNAYKTMFLGGGADPKVVGSNFREITFKETQGAGETRIAAAAGVPPVIVGLSEGLQAATYSNYSQAIRRFADMTMRPLWRSFGGAVTPIINVPPGSELWYDDRDIPFLAEDVKDAAEVRQANAVAIKTLVDAGYDPGSVVEAVTSGDLSRLTHTGNVSVQLRPAGAPAQP